MRLAMILCLRLVSVRLILMKNKLQYVHYLTKNPTFFWTRYFFAYKAFFRHVLSFSISVWSQPSRACYSIVIRWYLILSQRGRRLGKFHLITAKESVYFFFLFLFLLQWGNKGPDGRTRAKQLHVHGYRCSVGACARWWQQWQPQSSQLLVPLGPTPGELDRQPWCFPRQFPLVSFPGSLSMETE